MRPLQITAIEAYEVKLEFVEPYQQAYGKLVDQANIIILVHTNNPNIIGLGEACPHYPFTKETQLSVWTCLKQQIWPLIAGQIIHSVSDIDTILDSHISDDHIMAKGMINMAMWDIYAKIHHKPIYQCLAEIYKQKIYNLSSPLLYPLSDQSIEKDDIILTQKLKEGYKTFMLKFGYNKDIQYEIQRLVNINKKYGPIGNNIFIVCDANQSYSYHQALQFIQGCKKQNIKIQFFEQPIQKSEHEQLKKLKMKCIDAGFQYGLSLDESVQDSKGINYCLQHEIGSVFSIKVSKNGGISKLFKVAQKCKEYGIKVEFNSMLEFGIAQSALLNVYAVTSNIVPIGHCFMSCLRFKQDITDFSDLIDQNKVCHLSTKPGLGIQINKQKVTKFATKHMTLKYEPSKL